MTNVNASVNPWNKTQIVLNSLNLKVKYNVVIEDIII